MKKSQKTLGGNGPFLTQIRHDQNALSFNSSIMHWKSFFRVMSSVVFCLQWVFGINFIWLKMFQCLLMAQWGKFISLLEFNYVIWLLSFLFIWGAQGISKVWANLPGLPRLWQRQFSQSITAYLELMTFSLRLLLFLEFLATKHDH